MSKVNAVHSDDTPALSRLEQLTVGSGRKLSLRMRMMGAGSCRPPAQASASGLSLRPPAQSAAWAVRFSVCLSACLSLSVSGLRLVFRLLLLLLASAKELAQLTWLGLGVGVGLGLGLGSGSGSGLGLWSGLGLGSGSGLGLELAELTHQIGLVVAHIALVDEG